MPYMDKDLREHLGAATLFLVLLSSSSGAADPFDPSKVIWCNGERYYGACPTISASPRSAISSAYDLPVFSQALQLLRNEDYESAIAQLERAARMLPNDFQVTQTLAEARRLYANELNEAGVRLHDRGDFAGAVDKFNQAALFDSNRGDLFREFARISQQAADIKAAEERRKAELNQRIMEIRRQNLLNRAEAFRRETLILRTAQAAEERRDSELKVTVERGRAKALLTRVRRIEVPPPVGSEVVQIGFGQLPPHDKAGDILFGTEAGLAFVDVFAKVGEGSTLSIKVALIVGETLISGLDGAEIYVDRQNGKFDLALSYLKNPTTRGEFVDITRRLRNGRQLSENARIDMVRAAQAIMESDQGKGSATLLWDAMVSAEARNAAMTRFVIGVGVEAVGRSSGTFVEREMVSRDRVFNQATDILAEVKTIASKTSDPEALNLLKQVSDTSADIMESAYHTVHPGKAGVEGITSLYSRWRAEKATEIPGPEEAGR